MAKAIEEAIEEEISLVVAVAEFMPIHDLLRVLPLNLPPKLTLTVLDPFDVEDAIENSLRGSKRPRYHLYPR